ncbi:hypothetical protein BC826DRAFT_1051381 [Russula brevipes]|nr:hypothetical protein BC826DRAFT_1051381 [Russula brevipes]
MSTTANHPTVPGRGFNGQSGIFSQFVEVLIALHEESGGTTPWSRGSQREEHSRSEAKKFDEAGMQALKDDMDGVLIFFGSAVWLTKFLFQADSGLKEDPAEKSAYYQQQSAQALTHISQQIAAIGTQISIGSTPPLPDYAFHPSTSDCRVNICWLLSLVCSLSAALLATLVQQWARAYMRIFQRSSNPLKTARVRLFLFEDSPGLIHASLILFFLGLFDSVRKINNTVGFITVVPIIICGFLYLYSTIAPLWNPQSPYRNPLSGPMWHLIRKLRHASYRYRFLSTVVWPSSMEAHWEQLAMKRTEKRKSRDVRAVQWLVESINGSDEMENFVLAIPGSFNQEWGRNVWQAVVEEAQPIFDVQVHTRTMVPVNIQDPPIPQSTHSHFHPHPGPSRPSKEIAALNLCRCVRNLLEAYSSQGQSINKAARRRHLYGCVETAASLVCCTDVQLGWFGEIGEVLSELGYNERTNEPLTIRSNPSFIVRWTCLSLVAIGQMVMRIARFQPDYGSPDVAALKGAEKIDGHLRVTWEHVEDVHRAFEPWSINRTQEEIREILSGCQNSISELERIEIEVAGIEDLDWKISLLQGAMDEVTHNLTRRLPAPILINEAFDFPSDDNTPASPQLIFPGQRVQSLCALGGGLRDIIEERNPEKHQEILENLKSIDKIPASLRLLNSSMKQLWRLQDLRDGQGLGFIINSFRRTQLNRVFYTGTFKIITSQWLESKDSSGTKRILLDLICDLVVRNRGVFSDFTYPPYIEEMLLELVRKMVDGDRGLLTDINDMEEELRGVNTRNCMNMGLRNKALKTIILMRRNTASSVVS